jgi:hypothetical protein
MQKIIGGEVDLEKSDVNEYFTDAGRSSIRLILYQLKNKHFLVPDYICEIILKIFEEFHVKYSFYNIKNDLTINKKSITSQQYDVLYIINYFGMDHKIRSIVHSSKIVIEDNVFSPIFFNHHRYQKWVGFNSFRKISPLADGSIVKSSFTLSKKIINNRILKFSKTKYDAKDMKYKYLTNNIYSENEYLKLFRLAESQLDEKLTINNISSYSSFRLVDFMSTLEKEYKIRRKNYNYLYFLMNERAIKIKTRYPSFFLLFAERRDELREYLFSKNIFCPVHWPKFNNITNKISDTFLSIPVDSRYELADMKKIALYVNKFLESKKYY